MEQIIKDKLVLILETNGILTEYQSFRKNRSTIDQIIRCVKINGIVKTVTDCSLYIDDIVIYIYMINRQLE